MLKNGGKCFENFSSFSEIYLYIDIKEEKENDVKKHLLLGVFF